MRLVVNGKKTSTVRLGQRPYPLGPARIVSGSDEILVEILQLERTTIGGLTDEVAKSEGYESLSDLLNELRRFYPSAGPEHNVTVVRFRKV